MATGTVPQVGSSRCQFARALRTPLEACSTSVNRDSLPPCPRACNCSLFRSLSKPSISWGRQTTGTEDCVMVSKRRPKSYQNLASPGDQSPRSTRESDQLGNDACPRSPGGAQDHLHVVMTSTSRSSFSLFNLTSRSRCGAGGSGYTSAII